MTFTEWLEAEGLSASSARLYDLAKGKGLPGLRDESLSPSRRDTIRKALRRYAQFTGDADLEAAVASVRIRGRSRRVKVVEALDPMTEYLSLLVAIKAGQAEPLRSALLYLATSGLRISELLDLTHEVLREALEKGKSVTTQKGGYERWVFCATSDQWEAVSGLLDAMSYSKRAVWKLFLTRKRKTREGAMEAIRVGLTLAARQAGITKKVHPHLLRKAIADYLREKGASLKVIQEMLGHRSERITLRWYQDHAHPDEVLRFLQGDGK